jgi:hypothetical protein
MVSSRLTGLLDANDNDPTQPNLGRLVATQRGFSGDSNAPLGLGRWPSHGHRRPAGHALYEILCPRTQIPGDREFDSVCLQRTAKTKI